jgi:hypothetical protein
MQDSDSAISQFDLRLSDSGNSRASEEESGNEDQHEAESQKSWQSSQVDQQSHDDKGFDGTRPEIMDLSCSFKQATAVIGDKAEDITDHGGHSINTESFSVNGGHHRRANTIAETSATRVHLLQGYAQNHA